jgi:hypothetical protein
MTVHRPKPPLPLPTSLPAPTSDRRTWLLLAVGSATSACSVVQSLAPKATVDVHTKNADGKETHYHKDISNYEDLKDLANDAADAASSVTKTLIEKLTEVPPPGDVTLATLSPALAEYEGTESDYLARSKAEDPTKFQYVQIGVRGYDAFFQACAEFYAFVYQSTELLLALEKMVSAALKGESQKKLKLAQMVDVSFVGANGSVKAELVAKKGVAVQIASLVPTFIEKGQNVVVAAKQLIDDSQNALTAPMLIAHVDLIVTGIKAGASMAQESGKLLGETSAELLGFRREESTDS